MDSPTLPRVVLGEIEAVAPVNAASPSHRHEADPVAVVLIDAAKLAAAAEREAATPTSPDDAAAPTTSADAVPHVDQWA